MDSIPPCWHIARLSLLGRPSRTWLVAVSVALASMLVVTVSCALSTGLANVTARVHGLIGEADAVVVHEHGSSFDEALITDVRTWPGVQTAAGRMTGTIALERCDIDPLARRETPRATVSCRGVDLKQDAPFEQRSYQEGRAPIEENEIALDPVAQQRLGAVPGTRVRIVQFGDPVELVVTGVFERPTLGALQRPTGVLSREVLARVTDQPGSIYSVSIVLDEGIDATEWIATHSRDVDPPLRLDGADLATSGLSLVASESRVALSLGSLLAFLCCSFIIATAMTTALNEQQRTFAVARCIGAGRAQLFAGQIVAGSLLGLAGGLIGVPLGVLLTALLVQWNSHLLPEGLTVSWFGFALALAGSVGSGVIGALWPAWIASRVTALRALSPNAFPPPRRAIWIVPALGALCLAVQLSLTLANDSQHRFWLYAVVGLPLLHLGWFLLAIPTLRCIGAILTPPLEHALWIAPGLLRGSLVAHAPRMGLIAGALMIGVGILISSSSNGSAILENLTQRVRFGDAFVLKSSGFTSEQTARVRSLPRVTSAAAVGYLPLKVIGGNRLGLAGISTSNVVCVGFDSVPFFALNRLEWIAGNPTSAAARLREGNAVLVAQEFLTARGLGLGATLQLGSDRDHHPFEVVGVVSAAGLDVATQFFGIRSMYMEHAAGCVFMDFDAVERHFGTREAFLVQLEIDPSATTADEADLARSIEEIAPGGIFASGRSIRGEIMTIGGILLTVSATVAIGALVLASFASGSVIAAGVSSRSYEFGVLQAVGSSRGMLCRIVLAESMIIGLSAGVVGTLFGVHVGWMGTQVYRDLLGLTLGLPLPLELIAGGIGAVCVTALAAALPSVLWLTRQSPRALLTAPRN